MNHDDRDAKRDDRDAKRDDRDDADANTATTATQWLSVAVAARLVGVSPRAIQRRCQSGKYNARLVRAPKGEVWEVDSATLETSAIGTATLSTTTATLDRDDADAKRDDRDANHNAQPQNTPAAAPQWKEREGELKDEIRFLRNVIEAQQRDAAELRQSLKKALEIAPRQLTQGNAPQAQNAPTAPAKRPAAPAITPTEGDDLSEDEIDELCRRFFEATP